MGAGGPGLGVQGQVRRRGTPAPALPCGGLPTCERERGKQREPHFTTNTEANKLGAEKLTSEEQRRWSEKTARDLDCDESEEWFEAALKVVGKPKKIED